MNFTDMYESYHKLKGNSFIEKDIKPQFYALPLKREAQVSKTSKKNSRRIKKVVFEESPSKIEEEVKHEG